LLTAIQATKLSEEFNEHTEVSFEVDATLTEVKRSTDKIVIKFNISLEPEPSFAKLSVAGLATLQGDAEEIMALIEAQEGKPPRIFMLIYQKIYPTLYLLCCSLNIPSPGPKLLITTQIVSPQEAMQTVES